jgi:DNA-binding response OmpR family regulator
MTKRILHVEDEECVINFVKRALQPRDYDIVNASTLDDAKEKAKQDFDLYLIDGNFPSNEKGLAGLCFYEYVKSKGKPCIFFSSEQYMGQKAKELGIKYIEKPVDLDILLKTIDSAFNIL